MDDKFLTIASKNKKKGTSRIPWSAVSGLDVQVGYRRPLLKSALIGGALGAVIGSFLPLDKTCNTPEQVASDVCSRGQAVGWSTWTFALLSFGGQFLYPPEHYDSPKWKPLVPPFYQPLDPGPVSLQLTPMKSGFTAQLTLRF